jgi:hypothetical protein
LREDIAETSRAKGEKERRMIETAEDIKKAIN